MIRIIKFLLISCLFLWVSNGVAQSAVISFDTVDAAQAHCPNDEVVWYDSIGHFWYTKDDNQYANTEGGYYICKLEAVGAGYPEGQGPGTHHNS